MMKESFKVSVCVPIFNVEAYIERCAISLFEQTYNNIELVFVNDCSPDRSLELLNGVITRYSNQTRSVVLLNNNKNCGIATVRNLAVRCARGEFVFFVDSDDFLETDAIEIMVSKQLATGADIVSSNYYKTYTRGETPYMESVPKEIEKLRIAALNRSVPVHIWGRLIRRSLFIDNNVQFIDGCNMGEDFQVIPRLFYFAKRTAHIENCIYHYNLINASSYSSTFTEKQSRQVFEGVNMLKQWLSDKEVQYQEALYQGEAFMLAMYMVACVRSGNKTYSQELRKKMSRVGVEQISAVPILYRMTYRLRNYYILRMYVFVGHVVKKRWNRISKSIYLC